MTSSKCALNPVIAVVLGLFIALQSGNVFAEAKLGGMTCYHIAGTSKNLLIHSSVQVRCVFQGNGGAEQWYIGETGITLGIDLKFKGNETLHYAVISSTANFVPEGAFLSGKYRGGEASAAFGIGVGAQVLLGGGNDAMALQPAVETSTGSAGVSAGIGFLNIEPDPLNQARLVTPHGALYTQTMYSGYFSHAFDHYHLATADYAGSDYFSGRAITAAGGAAPSPAAAPAGEAEGERARLVVALTRYAVDEVDAAMAQVAYDCWVYGMANKHVEEAGQCRTAYLNHVDKLETAVAEQDLEVLVMMPMRQRILFDTDVWELDEHAVPVFVALIERLRFLSLAKIYVAGRADKPGTPEYNQTLSEKRAAAVTVGLIAAGGPEEIIVAEAFGSAAPVTSNPYDALNRRVDIVLEPLEINMEAVKAEIQRLKAME